MTENLPQPADSRGAESDDRAGQPPLTLRQRRMLLVAVDQLAAAQFVSGASYGRHGDDPDSEGYHRNLTRSHAVRRVLEDLIDDLTWWLDPAGVCLSDEAEAALAPYGFRGDIFDYDPPLPRYAEDVP